MTIRKAVRTEPNSQTPSKEDIDRIINAGGTPPKTEESSSEQEVRFQMVVPGKLCGLIDEARKLTKTSRRAWLLAAASEKLKNEGLI